MSTDGLLMLDAILAAEWMRRNHPDQYYNDGAKSEYIEPQLPLAEIDVAGHRIYRASAAQYLKRGEYIHYWHKRLDEGIVEKHIDRPRKVDTKAGHYKGYRMPLVVQLAGPMLYWFCLGDLAGAADLLSGVKALGKKRSQGFGMVALDAEGRPAWTVEEWPEDWSLCGPDGRLMRPVPIGEEIPEGARVMRWGIRPPFWLHSNKALCQMPEVGEWDGTVAA